MGILAEKGFLPAYFQVAGWRKGERIMPESGKFLLRQTASVLLGQVICLGIMFGVYAALNKLDGDVLSGGVLGTLLATLHFFFLALTAALAADRAKNQDVAGGQKLLRAAYPIRLLILAAVLILCGRSGKFDILATVLPLAFVRPVLTVMEFLKKKDR